MLVSEKERVFSILEKNYYGEIVILNCLTEDFGEELLQHFGFSNLIEYSVQEVNDLLLKGLYEICLNYPNKTSDYVLEGVMFFLNFYECSLLDSAMPVYERNALITLDAYSLLKLHKLKPEPELSDSKKLYQLLESIATIHSIIVENKPSHISFI